MKMKSDHRRQHLNTSSLLTLTSILVSLWILDQAALLVMPLETEMGNLSQSNSIFEGVLKQPKRKLFNPFKSLDPSEEPSTVCREIIDHFASAVSNFTFCSVKNARPIHICTGCVGKYLTVLWSHSTFQSTRDKTGNPCKDYFVNVDKVEIVSDAFLYVRKLWAKGNCDSCFMKSANGSIESQITSDTADFEANYELVRSCFESSEKTNKTCFTCREVYDAMNEFYLKLTEKYGRAMCLDIVDTMNSTRDVWCEHYECLPSRRPELWLHVAMGIVAVIPIGFYFLSYQLGKKQDGHLIIQSRIAETYNVNSERSDMENANLGDPPRCSIEAPQQS